MSGDNMRENLKPCPFCGGKVVMWERNFGVVTVFQCEQCKALIVFPWNKTPGDWNRRSDDGHKNED